MNGSELTEWRQRNGYTQQNLMLELDIRARQTISSWEKETATVPRIVELALLALERFPESKRIEGKKASTKEQREYFSKPRLGNRAHE